MVHDINTLSCQHTLRLDRPVNSLLSVRGKVWGTLGNCRVLVWGKAVGGVR